MDVCADAMLDTSSKKHTLKEAHTELREAYVVLDELSPTEWTFIAVSNQYEKYGANLFGMQNSQERHAKDSQEKHAKRPGLNLPLGPSDTAAFFKVKSNCSRNSPIASLFLFPAHATNSCVGRADAQADLCRQSRSTCPCSSAPS